MKDEIKSKQIYEILLTPIVCEGYSKGKVSIVNCDNYIKSTQTYYPYKKWNIPLDEDMSDFAMGFYEIIYKNLLSEKLMVNEHDVLCDRKFAGDTMNSFNYIANLFPQASCSRGSRTPKSQWPTILQKWKEQYHCLANFWIIPIEIGRKNDNDYSKGSYKNGLNDYMDRFLKCILKGDNLNNIFSGIYNSFDDFSEKHFLYGSYVYGDSTIYEYSYKTEAPEIMINKIIDRIKIRATTIAISGFADELWDYFHKWDLL